MVVAVWLLYLILQLTMDLEEEADGATAPAKNAALEVSAAAYCGRVLPMSSSCFGGLK